MTTPNRPTLTDDDLERTLRAWLEPGPRTLSEPSLERVAAAVRATRQMPAWRTGTTWGRLVVTARLAAGAAVVVALIGAGAFLAGLGARPQTSVITSPPAASPATIAPSQSSPAARPLPVVSPTSLEGTVKASGATWRARFPQVSGVADPAVASTVNTRLLEYVQSAVRAFSRGEGATPPLGDQPRSELQVDYSVAYRSPALLSLRLVAYVYSTGAAHGMTALTTFTFDLATGRQVALGDLFVSGARYLEIMAAESRRQLRDIPSVAASGPDLRWLTTGSAPTADNYAGWAITAGGLEVTFGEYQVAPYASGMPVVTIPFAHLAGVLDPAGPLGPLLGSPLPAVTVILGIYSGRPDRSWTLSDVQAAAVVGQLASLATTNTPPLQGGLGYHGFTIVLHQPGQPDQTFVAYRGTVVRTGDPADTVLADPDRTLETDLLDSGRAHLTAQEASIVEADLAAP